MLDPHQHRPEGMVPPDGQGQGGLADHPIHRLPHLPAILPDPGHRRPVIVGLIQVVPAHLVHAHGEHGLQPRVDPPGHQARQDKLVDEEGGGVPQVEDQGMAQADRLAGIGLLVVGQQLEEGFVAIEGRVEVTPDLGALGLRVGAVKTRGAGKQFAGHDPGRAAQDEPGLRPGAEG